MADPTPGLQPSDTHPTNRLTGGGGMGPLAHALMLTGRGARQVCDGDTPPHVHRVLSKPSRPADIRAVLLAAESDAALMASA
jgi:hypothetical protein